MPFINVDMDQDYEDHHVSEGSYLLRIDDAKDGTSKNGADQIALRLSVQGEDDPNISAIFHYLTMPGDDDIPEQARTKMKFVMRFIKHFQVAIDGDGFNSEDLIGLEAECLLGVKEHEGNIQNDLKLPPVA